MQFINYFFASLISFFGLLAGIILVKIAPEEQKPLENYFILMRKLLLLLIFIFLFFYYFNVLTSLAILIICMIFAIFAEYKINNKLKKSMASYAILGALFFFSAQNTNLFTIESSLLFLFGASSASLIYNKKERNDCKIIFYNIHFIAIAGLLFFITRLRF